MAARTYRRGSTAVATTLGVALALSACGGSSGDSASTSGAASSAAGAAGGDCAAFADYGKFEGKKVEIYTSIRDVEAERFEKSFEAFQKCTGIDIQWNGSGEFETQLQVRVKGNNAPDLAPIPQPGLLQTLVGLKAVKPASDKVKAASEANFSKDWLAYGTIGGTFYAPPLGANVKSFVWYSPKMFKDNGWTVPQTWDELLKLSDTIAASGKVDKPWCAGFESGDATGWPGTDWIEDIMLRTQGPDVYDQWYQHKIPFNDPKVIDAFDKAGAILKNDKYMNGGYGDVKSIVTTAFQDGGKPIVEGQCAMHRQASFYANQWPEGTKVAEDGDVFAFYLPPVDAAKGKPVLGGGEFLAAFNDKPETQAVQLYLQDANWVNEKAKLGDWITPNKQLKVENVLTVTDQKPNPIQQLSVKILQDPTTVFRFDASDLMPAAVGAGTFWKGMVNWITGADSKTVTGAVEASWPKS
ncbi:MAG: carbohydrate ABC transporter substrate-binding protein [Kineosporiaceae bacterium]|nr:carbohydrate ABC transporter substrate-binding protein [Kineosporiaceae bacterium]